MYKKYLPTKKVILLTIGIIAFITWLFWVPTTPNFQEKGREVAKKINLMQSDIDTDRDGLKDWEESLWKTDPKNPDTDGDGTSDGDEIIQKRNPLIPGPDDEMKEVTAITDQNIYRQYERGENLTDYISREFLIKYFEYKNKGEDPVNALPETLANKIDLAAYHDEWTINDILIKNDNSASAIKTYINSAGQIVGNELKNLKNNEVDILKKISETKDYSLLNKLKENADAYGRIAYNMRKVIVPDSLSDIHLEIINTAANAEKADTEMQNMESDSMLAVNALNEYVKALDRFQKIADDIRTAAENNYIVFDAIEPGYFFINLFSQ